MTDRTTVSPPKPESKMPMGRSATVDQSRRSPQQTPHMAIHLTVSALLRASGPELSLEAVLGLVDGALVSAGREVLPPAVGHDEGDVCRRSEEHTSELQSLMRISYAVFCLKK